MENLTWDPNLLLMEPLQVSPRSSVAAFLLLLLVYVFIMVSNLGLVVLIGLESSLHQPMYLLFCNMSLNDAFGATTIIPRLLSDLLTSQLHRHIFYSLCVLQAFWSHFHAGTSHSALMIMAFDRYVAICNPLRYSSIMTGWMVLKLSVAAWMFAFISVLILIGLTMRLSRCRRFIFNPICDNASLFKLSCEDLLINHIYGLGSAVVILGSSLASVALTYLRITVVCLSSKNKALNSRALQTCATHLLVYFVMLISSFTPMIMHRNPQWADGGKVASVMFHVAPPTLNPLIYGLQCKELRHKILSMFQHGKKQEANREANEAKAITR